MQSAAAVALMPLMIFAAFTASVFHNGFLIGRATPDNCLFPLGDLDPI